MAAKYRLTRKGANRLDVVMRYQAGLLGMDASGMSASKIAVDEGLLEIVDVDSQEVTP